MKYDDYDMKDKYMDEEYFDEEYNEEEEFEGCEDEFEKDFKRKKKLIEVEEVVGTGSAETVVEICVPLRPPAFEVMTDLVTKEVIFDALVASKGKVFVNGRVIKDIPYKTKSKKVVPGCPAASKLVYGDIRHVTAEVPFALCIDVPEACKGMKVVVLDCEVNSVEIPNHKDCLPGKCVAKCEPAFKKFDNCSRKLFCSLTEKDCIFVKVKVVKDVIVAVPCKDFKY